MKAIIALLFASALAQHTMAQFISDKLENKNGLYLYNEKIITRHEAFTMLKKNKDSKTAFYISRTENTVGLVSLASSVVFLTSLATGTDTEKKDYLYPGIGAAISLGLLLDASNHLQKSIQQFNNGIRSTSERRMKIDWHIGIGYGAVRMRF